MRRAPSLTVAPRPRGEQRLWILAGFIALSLLAHAAAFFLFQVVYPQRATLPPPGPQVSVLMEGTPENDAILRWVAAEDPALAASSPVVAPPNLFDNRYHPSFESLRTPPRIPAVGAVPPEPPPSPITLPLLPPLASTPAEEASSSPPPISTPTTAAFEGALRGRSKGLPASIEVHASGPLQPVVFLLGVDEKGAVQFVFRQAGSGDAEADQAARAALSKSEFEPSGEAGLTWGRATITWGREIYPETAEPAP